MAINNKVEITSANAVLDWYDDQPKAAYKLCRGTTLNKDHIVDVYDSTDKDAGYKQLFKVITRLANEVSNTNTYFICMTGKGSELLATTTFQLNTFQIGNVNNGGNDYRVNNEMLSRLSAIEQKLNEEEEEIIEEEKKPNYIESLISGFSTNPAETLNGLIGLFTVIKTIMKGTKEPNIKTMTMAAGVPNENGTLDDYIGTLITKGVQVEDFKTLSEMSETKIKTLLNFIR